MAWPKLMPRSHLDSVPYPLLAHCLQSYSAFLSHTTALVYLKFVNMSCYKYRSMGQILYTNLASNSFEVANLQQQHKIAKFELSI